MTWSAAGPWLREYVEAVRALWDCWQNGGEARFSRRALQAQPDGAAVHAGADEHPHIPVELAAVNPYMCQVAGEVADGIRAHPIATPRYIAETMLPAVQRGAAKTGRDLSGFTMRVMPLIATAPDRASLDGADRRRPGAGRVLRLDPILSPRVRERRVQQGRARAAASLAGTALGRDGGPGR